MDDLLLKIAESCGGLRRTSRGFMCRCAAHDDSTPSLSIAYGENGRVLLHCFAGCDPLDVIDALRASDLWENRGRTFVPARLKPVITVDNRSKARWLWRQSQPIQRTLAEIYLRRERGICCAIPTTLRFLPGNARHPPSMIAAFGFPAEPEPGVLSLNENDIAAVHLTKLTADGRKHADEPNKIMLGSAPGVPVVIAPANDLFGLVITEGLEDGLSMFEATGCGVWVAGCADRMPKLSTTIPTWVECVTICVDDDKSGRRNALALAELLQARGAAEIKLEGAS